MGHLDSAAVENRSNSDLLNIDRVSDDTNLSTPERMALILRIAQAWDRATEGTTARFAAERVLPTHYENGIHRPGFHLRTHQ